MQLEDIKDAVKYPTMHRSPPHPPRTKNYVPRNNEMLRNIGLQQPFNL